jgi:hypothetical protein
MKMGFGLLNVPVFLVVLAKVRQEKKLSKISKTRSLLVFKCVQNVVHRSPWRCIK